MAVGIYTVRSGTGLVFSSAVAAGLAIVGAVLGPWRRRNTLAHYYSEGLLVMSLAGAVLMVLLVAVGGLEDGLNEDTIVLLAALSLTLLLGALVFKLEDLFGFFGLSLLLLALAVFHVDLGPRQGSYLYRYSTVALAMGFALALAAAISSRWFRKRKGLERFAAALYVPALAAAAFALVLLAHSGNLYHRALDLAVVAVIIILIRPHVRHAVTNYAVAAAVTAGVYMFVAARWGGSSVEVRQAALIASGGLSFVWILAALIVRRIFLALGTLSDKEARQRGRPYTVVGMTMAISLAVWLTLMTVLSYQGAWAGPGPLARLLTVERFSPAAAMIAWAGILLAFLLSMWQFRHTWRTFMFYLVGSSATVTAGLLFGLSSKQLISYLICAIPGYGAIHLLVYLRERQFMSLLSNRCALYKDEVHASTTIFTAGCISCFIGGIVAAFNLHTLASLVTLSIMTAVFLVWSIGGRRPEMLYPTVLFSTGVLLSIWHYVDGLGPWNATRVNINSVVFAGGGLVWMAIGTALNRLRGPMSVLASPARYMSVVLGLAGLGFLILLAVCPTWHGASWAPDASPWRLALGTACGLALAGYFLWAAYSFRRTLYIYLVELSVATLLVMLATRTPAVWNSPLLRNYWPPALAALSLLLLGLARWLESRHQVLYSRPLFFTATVFLPVLPFVGGILFLQQAHYGLAAATFALLTVTCLLGSLVRARGLLRSLAALGANAMLACFWFWRGVSPAVYPRLYLVPAGATIVALALIGRRGSRPRASRASQSSRRLLLLVGVLVAFAGCVQELVWPESGAQAALSAGLTAIGLALAATVLGLQLRQRILNYAAAVFLAVCLVAELFATGAPTLASPGPLAIVVAMAVVMVASGLLGLRSGRP
ncbi:MAG: hypothetical protein GWP05_04010 [Anaerolineaceae bacterium]|nr:hypothetical protein [Anaerolineaceae bacterium]